jgi:isopenicillin N synthase-like dioxygenase
MVTLLATDDQPGLQILINKESQEEWVAVQPPPIGTFVVNLGSCLFACMCFDANISVEIL